MNLKGAMKKHWIMVVIICAVILSRIPVLSSEVVPFQFDHGKDAIAVLHMWQTVSPKLIGPWTSIPGLFFGPAWYYFLLPGMIISNGEPIASVAAMVILGIVTLLIVYKYFGVIETILLACSGLFYTITTSAWNPFPMVLISFIILALLKNVEERSSLTKQSAFALGFFSALGFHFSTAFAVFYPVLILLSVVLKKSKVTLSQILTACLGFSLPLLPQLLFEIRHDFLQVQSVFRYLEQGDSDPASINKLFSILSTLSGELDALVFPATNTDNSLINLTVKFSLVAIYLWCLFIIASNKKRVNSYLLIDAFLWFSLPIIAFTFLHFNVWYLLPIVTMTVVLVGQIVRVAPQFLLLAFIALNCTVFVSKTLFFVTSDKASLMSRTTFLHNKKAALDYIYATAGDKPFSSYHYMPDIYDYPYQYLYLISALHGKRLPVEFSYKPNEDSYIPEKMELLEKFQDKRDTRSPELVFLIVEGHDNPALYDEWQSQQSHGEIIDEKIISSTLTVYTALPYVPQEKP